MTIISVQVPDELYTSLFSMAKQLDRSSSSIVRQALITYLQELQEDQEDAEIALAVMKDKNMKCYTSEEMKKRLEARYRAEHGL